ncbi:phosphoglycerate kinase, cytosolic-like [Hevea brasiliensis]|nr:phosphoglycerate kinase, cytosolic-like [Hevea brasiliensis]
MANDCIGEEVEKLVAELSDGGVLLLENVRFHKEEEKNDPEFSKKLAALADVYVNDAFGSAHRAHASTEGVAKYLKPSVAGFLMQKELDYLVGAVANPKKPFAAIVGGLKVSTKIGVIESLLGKVDILILGGGMMFTLYKAQGYSVGSSLVEEDKLDLATSLVEKAKAKGVSLLLPTDVVIADKFAADANSKMSLTWQQRFSKPTGLNIQRVRTAQEYRSLPLIANLPFEAFQYAQNVQSCG